MLKLIFLMFNIEVRVETKSVPATLSRVVVR